MSSGTILLNFYVKYLKFKRYNLHTLLSVFEQSLYCYLLLAKDLGYELRIRTDSYHYPLISRKFKHLASYLEVNDEPNLSHLWNYSKFSKLPNSQNIIIGDWDIAFNHNFVRLVRTRINASHIMHPTASIISYLCPEPPMINSMHNKQSGYRTMMHLFDPMMTKRSYNAGIIYTNNGAQLVDAYNLISSNVLKLVGYSDYKNYMDKFYEGWIEQVFMPEYFIEHALCKFELFSQDEEMIDAFNYESVMHAYGVRKSKPSVIARMRQFAETARLFLE